MEESSQEIPPKVSKWTQVSPKITNLVLWTVIVTYTSLMVFSSIGFWGESRNLELGWIFVWPLWVGGIIIYGMFISMIGRGNFKNIELCVFFGYFANYFFNYAMEFHTVWWVA